MGISSPFLEQGFKCQQCKYDAITTMPKQLQSKVMQDQQHVKDVQCMPLLALISKPKAYNYPGKQTEKFPLKSPKVFSREKLPNTRLFSLL